jgi:hypothetical protein
MTVFGNLLLIFSARNGPVCAGTPYRKSPFIPTLVNINVSELDILFEKVLQPQKTRTQIGILKDSGGEEGQGGLGKEQWQRKPEKQAKHGRKSEH